MFEIYVMGSMEISGTPSISSSGFCGYFSRLGTLISNAGRFYLGCGQKDKIDHSSLPAIIAKHQVFRGVLVAFEVLLGVAAIFLSIGASPIFVSCWFLGLFAPFLAIAAPLIASFSENKTKEEEPGSSLFAGAENITPSSTQTKTTDNEAYKDATIENQKETNESNKTGPVHRNDYDNLLEKMREINFDLLLKEISNDDIISPDTPIIPEDMKLIRLIIKCINNGEKKGSCNYIDPKTVKKYKDLWKITIAGHLSGFRYRLVAPKKTNNSEPNFDKLQADIRRLIRLAAHFGNSTHPAMITIHPGHFAIEIRIHYFTGQEVIPATGLYEYADLYDYEGTVCCVCTGNSRIIEARRKVCANKGASPNAIFVENIYGDDEKGTIQIREKASDKTGTRIKEWQAEKGSSMWFGNFWRWICATAFGRI